MEYIVIASFNILFLLGVWFFAFKPAIKDRKRTELLVLKLQVRDYFTKNHDLNHVAFNSILEMLNRKTKALDHISLSSYIAWSLEIDKQPEVKEVMKIESKRQFAFKDKALKDFCEEVKDKSNFVAIAYMIESSFFAHTFYWLFTMYYFFKELIKKGQVQLEEVTIKVETKTEKIIKPSFIDQEILCQ